MIEICVCFYIPFNKEENKTFKKKSLFLLRRITKLVEKENCHSTYKMLFSTQILGHNVFFYILLLNTQKILK
jgi:hypothetical protein